MGFFDNLKATMNGENETGSTFVILDVPFKCDVCGHTKWEASEVQFGEGEGASINPGWPGNKARVLKCCQCDHLEWFAL